MQKKQKAKKGGVLIEIPIEIYRHDILIFCGYELESIFNKAKKLGFKELDDFREKLISSRKYDIGTTLNRNDRRIVIILWDMPKKATDYSILYHEIYHAVDRISVSVDPNYSLSDRNGISEARAYLYDYIATEANKVLWNI
ncbi:MAG TPA: hypothetical protein ENI23_10500 [bacterium]|nr:hypothetical protein [bacterium]